jgi:hypothetical protein
MGFLRFRSRVSIHGSVGWVNSIEASGSKSCSCLRNSASLIRGVLQNGCRAGQRQYGSCSSAALPPTDLGKLRTVRSRRTSLFFQTGQPSSSRTISCEAVGASQPRTTLFQFRSQKDDRLGSKPVSLRLRTTIPLHPRKQTYRLQQPARSRKHRRTSLGDRLTTRNRLMIAA